MTMQPLKMLRVTIASLLTLSVAMGQNDNDGLLDPIT